MSQDQMNATVAANKMVRKHTAARTMAELTGMPGYTPALRGPNLAKVADAYDAAQRAKGDSRRAVR